MPAADRNFSFRFDAADEEVERYRAVSSLALAGLAAGLLSPLAMFASVLWLAPLTAVVLSGLALRRIASRPSELIGRPAALVGLLLGAAFLVAAPVEGFVYRYVLRQQAGQFAGTWIDAVRHGEVYKAHRMMINPQQRPPLENDPAEFYRRNPKWREMLDLFVDEPTIRTLFALGPAAKIRFYETVAEGRRDVFDVVQQTYAVTYRDEHEQPKTFFITLLMQRSVETGNGQAHWTLLQVEGGVRPSGW